jgi:hypothetical protein
MGRSISLFSGYEQKENRTTNYVLLMFKLVYEESPSLLGEVLSALVGQDIGDAVGVEFRQQERRQGSVPDGLILQRPFEVYVETKQFDWFYDKQIAAHLEALDKSGPGLKLLLALSNFEEDHADRFKAVHDLVEGKFANRIAFGAATFEDLLKALKELALPPALRDTLGDFAAYLDDCGLLPGWRSLLDVVNCANTTHEIEGGVYLCPAQKGAYQHQRSKFFGMYKDKAVRTVAEIEGVIDLVSESEEVVRWINGKMSKAELVKIARTQHARFRPNRFPHRVFVLGERYSTLFWKDSKGGMQGSKQYFIVQAENAAQLADQIRDKEWSIWRC